MADKKTLSEQEIRDRDVTPAIVAAGGGLDARVRENLVFTSMQQAPAADTLIPGS